jgi:heat shock protein HslJ
VVTEIGEGPNVKRLIVVAMGLALALALVGCSSGSSLTGKAWQWTSGTEAGTPMPGVVPDPSSYTATFNTDNSLNVKADCNNANGTYQSSGSTLTISFGVTTLAACPAGSLGSVFLAGLEKAASYAIASNVLTITLSDGGTMSFK